MKIIILIASLFLQIHCQCKFLDYIYKIDDSNNPFNYSSNFTISEEKLFSEQFQIGFGFWIKYQPFKKYVNGILETDPPRNFNEKDQIIQRKKEQFIFSMKQSTFQSAQIILTLSYDVTLELFQYYIYIDFWNTTKKYILDINPSQIEGQWYIFFVYSDLNTKISIIGFFEQELNEWRTIEIQDVPQMTSEIEFHLGGGFRMEQYKQNLLLFEKFYGTLTPVFTTYNYNLINNDLGDCLTQLSFIYPCYGQIYSLGEFIGTLNGSQIIISLAPYVYSNSFVINGWVKLDQLQEKARETMIMRAALNSNYDDDENIGDRLIYLQYFQNQIPYLNGLRISTQGYEIPLLYKYQTQPQDIIESLDEDYYYKNLLTKWHIIQFEKGTLNNNGFPSFYIYFPELGTLQLYWDHQVNYFSTPSIYFYFGGDKFSKSFMRGSLAHFYFQEICDQSPQSLMLNCHQNCYLCDGPTENSCLQCAEGSRRVFDELSQSCLCSDIYLALSNYLCVSLSDIGLIPFEDYESIRFGKYQLCQPGYFFRQNQCFECPYYELFQSKIKITCADCYLNQKQFSQTLTCTFDYQLHQNDTDFAYQKYDRSQEQIEIYKIDNILNKLIKLEYKQLDYSFQCLNGQIFQNGKCLTINRCNNVEIINGTPVSCLSCEDGFYLKNNQCLECGKFCKSCNSFGQCNFCLDPQLYYLTFDGINCRSCKIQQCKFCFQYYILQGQIYSTLDANFQTQNLNKLQIYDGCALCVKNNFFNFQTYKCEIKCSNLNNDEEISNCSQWFNDCQFGIIQKNNQIQCVQSQNSLNSILNQNCDYIENCNFCTNPQITSEISKCVICKEGYYIDLVIGKCLSCPNECSICFQESVQQQDYWKQQIYGFYQFIINYDGYHQFEEYAISKKQQKIKCLSCIHGYVLYNDICIEDCDSSCKQCIIDQGQSVCIQCGKKIRGYMRTKQNQRTCNDCANGCAACVDRELNQIQEYNPYFILTSENIKYTRKCFEVFDDQENSNKLFVDYQNLLVIQCLNENFCMNKIKFQISVYCSFKDVVHDSYRFLYTVINQLFQKETYQQIEDTLSSLLIQLSTQQIDIYLNFIQGSAKSCIIKHGYQLTSLIQKTVFSLKEVNLFFIGSQPNTSLTFEGNFFINNYKSVTFKDFQISFHNSQNNQLKIYKIYIDLLASFLQLNFENCIFTSKEEEAEIIQLGFQIDKPYNLFLKNVIFTNFSIQNSRVFSTRLCFSTAIFLDIENMSIQESSFYNTTFYELKDNEQQYHYIINFLQFSIINSKFETTSILKIESSNIWKDSQVSINKAQINNSQFTNSIIFRQPSITNFTIFQLEVQFGLFENKSLFINTQFVNITNLTISTIKIFNSNFISNYRYDQMQYDKKKFPLTIGFNQIKLFQIITDSLQPLIQFCKTYISFDFKFILDNIRFKDIQSASHSPILPFQSYQSRTI